MAIAYGRIYGESWRMLIGDFRSTVSKISKEPSFVHVPPKLEGGRKRNDEAFAPPESEQADDR
ncbi:hypothetical protein HYALB_00009563 [Hymenoscyphus albidus]|uniref:Uncharacterized protein n=1 Tax=Hymenoscyphus albidus TaxID=595503 RepID=A0A9N9LM74_9HELO|nr:hypothetical protein HYALB_00009563 [Hymenoscyphus albidus]